jgi:hypothetical protein
MIARAAMILESATRGLSSRNGVLDVFNQTSAPLSRRVGKDTREGASPESQVRSPGLGVTTKNIRDSFEHLSITRSRGVLSGHFSRWGINDMEAILRFRLTKSSLRLSPSHLT